MRAAAAVSLIIALIAFDCLSSLRSIAGSAPQRVVAARSSVSSTDQTVLAVVLNHEFSKDKGTIVLEDTTSPASTDRQNTIAVGLKKGWLKPVPNGESAINPSEQTVSDWMRRNRKPVRLPALRADRKATMLTERERDRIFAHGRWPAFYKRFPNSTGLTKVSLPGYSNNGSEAVVLLGNQRQGRWGHGTLYLLTLEKGQWRIRGTMGLWRS